MINGWIFNLFFLLYIKIKDMKKLLLILLLPLSVYSQSTQEQIDSLRFYMHKELNEYRAE